MKIITGNFYFVSNDFFEFIHDPFLKINYENTKRPHYFAFKDERTNLFWLVPCSSKTEKYEKIVQKRKEMNKSTSAIQFIRIFNKKSVLLFQDMFPIIEKYIDGQYIKGGKPVHILDQNKIKSLENNAKTIIYLIHRGVRFTPTQPDALRIEKLMLKELESLKS